MRDECKVETREYKKKKRWQQILIIKQEQQQQQRKRTSAGYEGPDRTEVNQRRESCPCVYSFARPHPGEQGKKSQVRSRNTRISFFKGGGGSSSRVLFNNCYRFSSSLIFSPPNTFKNFDCNIFWGSCSASSVTYHLHSCSVGGRKLTAKSNDFVSFTYSWLSDFSLLCDHLFIYVPKWMKWFKKSHSHSHR